MISGLTLLRAEEAPQAKDRWSYILMAEELRRVVAEAKKDAATRLADRGATTTELKAWFGWKTDSEAERWGTRLD